MRTSVVIGQNISVYFSIEYESDSLAIEKDTSFRTPFLLINYENQSDSNYYMPKITFSDTPFPCIGVVEEQPVGLIFQLDDSNLREIRGRFSDSSFVVSVDQFWDLYANDSLMQTENEDRTHVALSANTEIADRRSLLTELETKALFNEIDILPENILSENNKYFIRLKPGEKHTDKYNLFLFKLFGGSYEFKLAPRHDTTKLRRYTLVGSDPSFEFLPLPMQVGGYYLYHGIIDCNSVLVKFDSQ